MKVVVGTTGGGGLEKGVVLAGQDFRMEELREEASGSHAGSCWAEGRSCSGLPSCRCGVGQREEHEHVARSLSKEDTLTPLCSPRALAELWKRKPLA